MKKIAPIQAILATSALTLLSSAAMAEQVVTLEGVATSYVIYGNGNPSTGAAPYNNNNLSNNTLNFIDGTMSGTATNVYGAYGAGAGLTATGNTVNFSGSTSSAMAFFYGAYTYVNDITSANTATGNSVNIINGSSTISVVVGGQAWGGSSAAATHNTVNIIDSTVNSPAQGGNASSSSLAIVTHNHVNIMNSTVAGNIMGGYTVTGSTPSAVGLATNNTITIGGVSNLSAATLYGGLSSGVGSYDIWTGNTLNVNNAGISAAGVYNFEYLNFLLPATMVDGETML
ncbi:MAG: hypothetical protein FWF24_04960, partial [Alphaproteobacteria bacterium]|nr:hypothetical protein [Alphaproteobacteria bacterium]